MKSNLEKYFAPKNSSNNSSMTRIGNNNLVKGLVVDTHSLCIALLVDQWHRQREGVHTSLYSNNFKHFL